jgi:hypothetical protein
MPTFLEPAAGKSHHVVFKYANDAEQIGLVIPDMTQYAKQPYQPFNPSIRQGEATQQDFSISSVWEIQNDWSGGTGHLLEEDTETSRYAFSQGLDMTGTTTIGPCLFTAQKGRLLPPPADVTVDAALTTLTKYIEFGGRVFAANSATPGVIYRFDASGLVPASVETLTGACTQLYTDGATLFACQGTAGFVRSTTDGTTWGNLAYEAYFLAKREENNFARINDSITANFGNSLVPNNDGTGPSYLTPTIGLNGTTATNMVYYKERLWIGKPEGLYTWSQGWVDCVVDCNTYRDTSNFKHLCVYKGLLWYQTKNKLFFTNGDSHTEVTPEELNGFTNIDFIYPTAGPLLLGVRMQSRAYLMAFNGIDQPGLHPLWSDADAARPIVGIGVSDLYSTKPRIYFTSTTTGTRYLDFKENWTPNTYHTKGTTQSYIELTKFTAGFRSVPKWWYEVALNVDDPVATTFCQIWYSVDDGTWTQMEDETGAVATLTLNESNKALFFPLETEGVKLELRLYLWTTSAASAASITAVTVRGLTVPKDRYQFSFPVLATETVQAFTHLGQDGGRNIQSVFETIIQQVYPFKYQDIDGSWHLVKFRTPYPLAAIDSSKEPDGNMNAEQNKIYQVLLVEIDELDSDASYQTWEPG